MGEGPCDPDTQVSSQSRNGGWQPAPLTSSRGLGSRPGTALHQRLLQQQGQQDCGPIPDHVHQNTRHNRKATDSKTRTGAEGLRSSTKFQW